MVPFLAVAAAAGAIDVEDDFFPLFPSTPLDPLELEVMAPPLVVVVVVALLLTRAELLVLRPEAGS